MLKSKLPPYAGDFFSPSEKNTNCIDIIAYNLYIL
nr:MAG TPA: hypothetical protein [Caudoviricetes sp.]